MGWVVSGGGLTHTDFISAPEKTMSKPYPLALWRVEDGELTNGLLPGAKRQNIRAHPARRYLRVFGSRAADFSGNGYALLEPISCEVREELNGPYDLTAELVADEKTAYIQPNSLIRAAVRRHGQYSEQLFRVTGYAPVMDSSGAQRIRVTAAHIFYDNNARALVDCRPTGKSGQQALDYIFTNCVSYGVPEFAYSTDISDLRTAYYEDVSVTSALIGEDNCFVNRWGGELHRDNFRFSINRRREGSVSCGVVRYGVNMREIDLSADYSELVTHLIARDNFGHRTVLRREDVPSAEIPFHVCRSVRLTYEEDDREQFLADAQAYFDEYSQPRVSIKVRLADIPADDPEYADFQDLDGYDVGDRLTVFHSGFGINYSGLAIVSRTYDWAADEVTDIEIGSLRGAVTRSAFMGSSVGTGSSAADRQLATMQTQLDEAAFAAIVTTPISASDGGLLTASGGEFLLYRE